MGPDAMFKGTAVESARRGLITLRKENPKTGDN
jgi:hypothetical protein